MSWSFVTSRNVKATRTHHRCLVCGRTIPIGKPAFNWKGLYDGEFQNSYMCAFCDSLNLEFEDDVCEEYFSDWLREQDFMKCPKCHSEQRYDFDWVWDSEHENIIITCTECDHEWVKHIGWEEGGEGMKSKWLVTSNFINDRTMYGVFRKLDSDAVDHSGNREYDGKFVEERRIAQERADHLNLMESIIAK